MDALRRRLRLAYLEGAEEDSQRAVGRGLTADEHVRVLGRYPGSGLVRGQEREAIEKELSA